MPNPVRAACACAAVVLFTTSCSFGALVDPIPQKIGSSSVSIRLDQIATSGISSPVFLTDAGDNSGRLFLVDQVGQVRVIQNGQLQSTPFLDVRGQINSLVPEYDER